MAAKNTCNNAQCNGYTGITMCAFTLLQLCHQVRNHLGVLLFSLVANSSCLMAAETAAGETADGERVSVTVKSVPAVGGDEQSKEW